MELKWYVVQAYSGHEQNVMRSLKERIERSDLKDQFGEILVPTEEVVEMRDGKKRKSDRKFFPGYVLVQMDMNDATWHLVKEAPGYWALSAGQPTGRCQSPLLRPIPSCSGSRTGRTNRGRRYCSNRARWSGSTTGRLRILTAWWKK